MSKRARTSSTNTRRAKRPVDKQMPNVTQTGIVAANSATVLYAAAQFPGTITGLRWDLSFVRTTNATVKSSLRWVIVVIPQSTTASTLSMTDGAAIYAPEQNVLAYGVVNAMNITAAGVTIPIQQMGSTKAMRKLKAGDALQFIAFGTATEAWAVDGTVQFFYKT